MKKYVLVMDSGIGGASILKEIRNLLPNRNYIYFADTKNSPYGNKSKNEILEIVYHNVLRFSKKYEIEALVLACNTASCVCSRFLRQTFPFPIVCVEPPIKVAVNAGYKNILVLATAQTLKSNELLHNYLANPNLNIKKIFPQNLATLIDNDPENLFLVENILENALNNKNYDVVVLGCTHYHFVKNQIEKISGKPVITCEKQVANYVKAKLEKTGIDNAKPVLKIATSKKNLKMTKFLNIYLNF